MAINIFDKYGIKEVANVYFQALQNEPEANIYEGDIVLYLDTLKVSTIEQTAEQSDARGGWSNPKLITWDYNKEITVTLEDALMSLESLRFMMGGSIYASKSDQKVLVRHTEEVIVPASGDIPMPKDHITNKTVTSIKASATHPLRMINLTTGYRTQYAPETEDTITSIGSITFKNKAMYGDTNGHVASANDHIRLFWEEEVVTTDAAVEISISPETYPGTYRVVGDTFIRSQKTGKDEAFQFVIGKAKVASSVTLTLEAEGDPSTFEMSLTVLRDDESDRGSEMMKLIRYGGAAENASANGDDYGSVSAGSSN